MIDARKSRIVRAAAWTVAVGALTGISGCKSVSTWSNVPPAVSTPSADPYSYRPDGYFHSPDPQPTLAPAPGLTEPGHSVPTDLPPPPAPVPEGTELPAPGDSLSAKSKIPWALRPMSFFNRKDAKSEVQSAATTNDQSRSVADRPSLSTAKGMPLPLTRSEEARPITTPNYAQSLGLNSRPAPVVPAREVPPETTEPLDDNYTGPIITPGSQYTVGQNVVIENWPQKRPILAENSAPTNPVVRLRKPTSQFTAEDFAPQAPSKPVAIQPPVQPEQTPASVPLLLPPGP